MKHYDQNLLETGEIPEQFSEMFEGQLRFLIDLTGNDEKINQLLLSRYKKTILISCGEVLNGKLMRPYIYNGKLNKIVFGRAGAQVGLANQSLSEHGWDFTTGIYIRKRAYDVNNKNTYQNSLPHEFYHAMSDNVSAEFNNAGICYTKSGFIITRYNKLDEEVSKIPAIGLTEGTTEMLANMFINKLETYSYTFPTFIARILNESKHQPSLIEAYLSDDCASVEKFFDSFSKNQTTVPVEDLINMTTSENAWRDEKSLTLIVAAMQYTINSLNSIEELQNFYDYVNKITLAIAAKQYKAITDKIIYAVKHLLSEREKQISSTTEKSF